MILENDLHTHTHTHTHTKEASFFSPADKSNLDQNFLRQLWDILDATL
jgi:hypothetical protein